MAQSITTANTICALPCPHLPELALLTGYQHTVQLSSQSFFRLIASKERPWTPPHRAPLGLLGDPGV